MSVPTSTTGDIFHEGISFESFEVQRMTRRLALLEESIARGERDLCSRVDPGTGEQLPAAFGGYRAQLLSNLAIEKALAERLRRHIGAR
ncbi:hypothetical protein [Rathayibacter toxicus]|uniref:Uncharacterized protein n=1 Tax=Rathayibacter toxicus TaxID=145458 RepID=A0A0C5BSL0_9MICO|nr:hypothetical protein [Rathayibacter toxicus]AJM77682.1 hypothetical protein TI83_06490 [Rathayibacter toxicus]ALS58158.1 hypothetical protein APU90_10595 [Rathayibacter toxicus]KKM45365.1 hypothetical protein VT73_06980 [Rathayibacter toxicus]PPG21807.1 hypothetical protein C5D15_06310 [Rathayibacter toxicus]PPG46769.1 hypothetical protein C5D16_06285 [Rathayibacter toxicus]